MKYVIEISKKGFLLDIGQKFLFVVNNPQSAKKYLYVEDLERDLKHLNSAFDIVPMETAIENAKRKKKNLRKSNKPRSRKRGKGK